MRFFPILIAMLLIPVLTLVHRYYYYQHMMVPLDQQIKLALTGEDFARVKLTLNYLDVTLDGEVPSLPVRERAQELVSAVPGVRCLPENNRLVVPASIEAGMDGAALVLKGQLRDAVALREVTNWLKSARPDLEVRTNDVHLSPYTASLESPRNGAVSPSLRAIWALVEVAPSLKIERNGNAFTVSGYVTDAQWGESLKAALLGTKTETTVDASQLRSGAYVRKARFMDADVLPEFLKLYFALEDTSALTADERDIHFSANVTDEIYATWKPLLEKLCDEESAVASLRFFPSIYHLPSYKPISKLPPASMTSLQNTFRSNAVRFSGTNASVTDDDSPKLNALAPAIAAAGAEARIIVGAYMDPAADPKPAQSLARRRAEEILDQMTDRGLPQERFEVIVFKPSRATTQAGAGFAGVVELFVK